MAFAPSRRRLALASGVSSLLLLAFCGLQQSFLVLSPSGAPSTHPEVRLSARAGHQQTPRAAPSAFEASWALPAALAVGAAVVLASHRDASCTTMYGKHDKKTFRGKQHAHTFGKYRLRKNKARRIQAIKNGTYDPENTPQRGQPEPEHTWDYDNLVENPIYYAPDYLKEAMYDYWDDVNEAMRKRWKEFMGIKGSQRYFKNWTPPGMEPPPEAEPPAPPSPPTPPPPASKPKAKAPSTPAPEEPEPVKEEEETPPEPAAEKKAAKPKPAEEPAPEKKAEKPKPAAEKKETPPPEPAAEKKAEKPKPAAEKKETPPPEPAPEKKAEKPKPAAEKKETPPPEPAAEKKETPPPEPAAEKKETPPPEPAAEKKETPPPEPAAEKKAPEPEPEKATKAEKAPEPEPEKAEKAPKAASPSGKDVKALRERSRAGILDCKKALTETGGDMEKAMEWLKKKGMAKADKKAGNVAVEGCVASYVHFNNKIAVLVEVNSETDFVASNAIFKEFTADVAMQIAANSDVAYVTTEDVPAAAMEKEKQLEMAKEDLEGKPDNIKEKIVGGRLKKKFEEKALMSQKWLKDEDITVQEAVKQTIAKLGENIVIRRFQRLTLGEGLEKKEDDFAAGVEKELAKYKNAEGEAKEEKKEEKEEKKEEKKEEPKEEKEEKKEKPKVAVSAAQVKELRGRSGAGILDAKKALTECEGDMDKAMEWLKKKGMAKADKKAGNLSAEGVIASYVHFNSKLGVLVEVNSETDFVAINAIFKEFASDVAMQIAANPDVNYVSVDDVPAAIMEKEKALEMGKEDLAGKPDEIKEKIVTGRLRKKFEESALLSQKWLKDEDKTVQEVLKEKIAKLGENLVIRRFARLQLGEGLEKKDDDFAAGVEKELAKYR